jgi:hypothetical protein
MVRSPVFPLVPAKAGTQFFLYSLALDSRFRGNEPSMLGARIKI